MPKYPRTVLTIAAIACALVQPAMAAEHPADVAAFDRIRSLAGTWVGRMEDPLAGPAAAVRYEVASAGHAVIEYQNPGQSFEAVTVYTLADGRLRATLYSGAGNQPEFRLGQESTADLLLFEFDGGNGFDPKHDGHVHQGEIRFLSADRIEQRWFHYVGPKEQGVTHWFLEREGEKPAVPAEPVEAAAPASP